MTKPVLGLYDNEDDLRDALADDPRLIERGLTLIARNYPVRNNHGASGAFDILARDGYGGYVIIEVKRSDTAARQALHELSKYIGLFMSDQNVDIQKIRCFVLSTHWHELDIPLAYFRQTVPIEVKGFEIDAPARRLRVVERVLPPVDILPKLCPDARFLFAADRDALTAIGKRLGDLVKNDTPLQAALLTFQDPEPAGAQLPRAVLCLWRIRDADLDAVDPKAALSSFEIVLRDRNGAVTGGLHGGWAWDGTTCPPDPRSDVRRTYGSLDWARIVLFNGKDTARYESALLSHGFRPYVIQIDGYGGKARYILRVPDTYPEDFDFRLGLADFVAANPAYCAEVAAIFAGIPPAPGNGGTVMIETTGE